MITLLEDRYKYTQPTPDMLTAAAITDYVPVRIAIRRALNDRTSLTVHITHPTLLHWFKDLRSYSPHSVSWNVVDPTEDFKDCFGYYPPPIFTPKLIVQLDLHALRPPPHGKGVDPIAWILEQKIHPLWGYSDTYPDHLVQIALWAIELSSPLPTYILPLAQQQLEQWATQNAAYRFLHAATISEDSTRLLLHAFLHRYDSSWLHQQHLANIPMVEVHHYLESCITLIQSYDSQITSYWNNRLVTSEQLPEMSIAVALEQMSGLSMAEVKPLISFINRHPSSFNADLQQQIASTFSQLPAAAQVIQELAAKIPVDPPTIPEPSSSTEHWLRWATQAYLPYFAWIIRHNQPRQHQQACARAFADWLFDAYPAWLNTETSPLIINQYQQMRQILDRDPDVLVVWLIVDGLTWWQGEVLQAECEQQGLSTQSRKVGIAALPSITHISKRVLVTGLPAANKEPYGVAQAAREQLGRSGIAHYVCYGLDEGIRYVDQDTSVQCLIILFNMLDTVAHATKTFTDDAGIRGYLDTLAQGLAKIQQHCERHGKRWHILIGSDHGSTLLPPDAPSLPLPLEAQEISDIWDDAVLHQVEKQSPRSVIINNLQKVSPDISTHWYVLESTRYQLAQHYLVPRGYAYVGQRPTGWTHGGLTPEEVIVPLLHLTPEEWSIEPIEVQIIGSLRANQSTPLTVEIVNANHIPLEMVHIQIEGTSAPPTIAWIDAMATYRMDISFPPLPTRETKITIGWEVQCTIMGKPYQQHGDVSLAIRRLQTEDTSLDDFFD
jgi:hypothetical protein